MARGPEDTYQPQAPISANGQSVSTTFASAQGACAVTVTGTWNATLVFEAATDPASVSDSGATWFSVNALATPNLQNVSTTTANGNWIFICGGYSRFRVRCTAFTSGSAVVALTGSCAQPSASYVAVNTLPNQTLMNGLSPAAPATTPQTALTGLDSYRTAAIYAMIQGATGGTLDIFIQSSYDSGNAWFDVIHYTQLAAAGAQVAWFCTITRGDSNATVPTSVNITNGTPLLAANRVIPDGFGNALRVVCVAGASTSAGATQTIKAIFSTQ